MTITINIFFFYYWIITIIYETINVIIIWKKFKKKTEQHEMFVAYKEALKRSASMQMLWKAIFSPLGASIAFIFMCIVSPIMFPFSLITLFKKLIGYKSELEKKVEVEEKSYEEAKKRSDHFMKNEVMELPEEPIE